jgi:transposase
MKPEALDLRQKLLQAYGQKRGLPRALAALFGVSHAFLEQWRRRRTTGEIAPRPYAGGRQARGEPAALTFVCPFVREPPDATLAELWAQLRQRRGRPLRVAPMGRVLPCLGPPRTNRLFRLINATRRGARRPVPPIVSRPPRARFGACSVSRQPASI